MYVPGTQITLTFINVPQGEYAPLYYGHTQSGLTLASANPGNSYGLYVGGDGGNGAFHRSLSGAGQHVDDYQTRHQALVAKITQSGSSASETYQNTDPTSFSYVQATRLNAKSYEGVCFTDIFDPKL